MPPKPVENPNPDRARRDRGTTAVADAQWSPDVERWESDEESDDSDAEHEDDEAAGLRLSDEAILLLTA